MSRKNKELIAAIAALVIGVVLCRITTICAIIGFPLIIYGLCVLIGRVLAPKNMQEGEEWKPGEYWPEGQWQARDDGQLQAQCDASGLFVPYDNAEGQRYVRGSCPEREEIAIGQVALFDRVEPSALRLGGAKFVGNFVKIKTETEAPCAIKLCMRAHKGVGELGTEGYKRLTISDEAVDYYYIIYSEDMAAAKQLLTEKACTALAVFAQSREKRPAALAWKGNTLYAALKGDPDPVLAKDAKPAVDGLEEVFAVYEALRG